ncbi:MAG: hypothetical protein H6850_01825 [Alphaproteobacteria bacterium]|nr:MAG: hypothetical protein H6850_01825 [Alphaproteobacteria bacterium]
MQRLFWSNTGTDTIASAAFDENGIATNATLFNPTAIPEIAFPLGAAVYSKGKRLFWINGLLSAIYTATFDDNGVINSSPKLFVNVVLGAQDLVISGQRLFWSNVNNLVGIQTAAFNASGDIVGAPSAFGATNVDGLAALAIASSTNRIFWANTFGGTVYSALFNPDGTMSGGETQLGFVDVTTPFGLAVLGERLFWSNEFTGTIYSGLFDATGVATGAEQQLNIMTAPIDVKDVVVSGNRLFWADGIGGAIYSAEFDVLTGVFVSEQKFDTGMPFITLPTFLTIYTPMDNSDATTRESDLDIGIMQTMKMKINDRMARAAGAEAGFMTEQAMAIAEEKVQEAIDSAVDDLAGRVTAAQLKRGCNGEFVTTTKVGISTDFQVNFSSININTGITFEGEIAVVKIDVNSEARRFSNVQSKLNSDNAVTVEKGEFSAASPTQVRKSIPPKISPDQLFGVNQNATLKEEAKQQKKQADKNRREKDRNADPQNPLHSQNVTQSDVLDKASVDTNLENGQNPGAADNSLGISNKLSGPRISRDLAGGRQTSSNTEGSFECGGALV